MKKSASFLRECEDFRFLNYARGVRVFYYTGKPKLTAVFSEMANRQWCVSVALIVVAIAVAVAMTSYIGIVIFVTVFLLRMCRLPISWKFPCDHPGKHGKKWKEKVNCLSGKCVEAGTLTNWYFITEGNEKYRVTDLPIAVRKTIVDLFLEVCWDCGTSQEYSFVREEWKALRVFDMGAAGT